MFQTKRAEEIKTQFYAQQIFSRKSCRLWDNVGGKNCRTKQTTDDNTVRVARSFWVTDYRHTLRICTIYCFSPTKMVTRTHLNVTLYVHSFYCFVASWSTLTMLSIYFTNQCLLLLTRYSIYFTSDDTKPAELWKDFVRVSDILLGYDAM